MRALAPTLVLLVLVSGCARMSPPDPAGPGIEARTAIVVEERSTCGALARADLGLMATDPAALRRVAAALQLAGERAPADVRPDLEALAHALRSSPASAASDPHWSVVLTWFNAHCGGVR
ncbi:MAG TPA: hypothetical protein VGO60_06735 [Iamia sp.]|jgi:hypothetical protein|nr:hypothetical protein [Iamia sp.]